MRLLCAISLFGEAVIPWSPTRTFKGGTPGGKQWWVHEKDKRLCAWQDRIREAHRKAYGLEPYLGPVMLTMTFYRKTDDESLWGKRWWTPKSVRGMADRVNLEKGAEDALTNYHHKKSGVVIPGVFANDSQTADGITRKRWGREDGIEIKVYGLEDGE